MRPTFAGFETAKSSIFANQKSIDIVGNNMANVDTNGYTRQRTDRTAVAPTSYTTRVASNRVGLLGQGVETLGVSQIRDSFLDKRFRDEYSKTSYHAPAASVLDDIQRALGDGHDITDESGLYGAIKQIYDSINDYIEEPTLDTEANLVLSAFKNMTQVLQQLDAKLTNVAKQQISDLGVTVNRANDVLAQIAHLNQMIGDDATVLSDPDNEYFRPNELLDQRNLLLDELAGYGDISVTQLANGKINVDMGGRQVVREDQYDALNLQVNDDNTVAIQWRSTGENVPLAGGSLLASIDYINGRGLNVQSSSETPQQGIPYYRDRLDTFANALAKMVNSAVPVQDEATGKPMVDADGSIVYKTLLGAKTPGGVNGKILVTAGNIAISDEWTQGGAGYFIYSKDEEVEDYAQKIAIQLTESSYTFDSYGEKFTGTFADYEVDFLGRLGADLAFQEGRQEATALVADDFLDRRDEISGVSQDEETTDMMKYQKSYEAAARLMTVLDELIDVIVNRMGRVGL